MKPFNLLATLIASLALVANGAIQTNDVPFEAAVLGAPVIHDGYLYMSADTLFGGGLAVFDLSDPAAPIFAAGVRTAGPASAAPAFLGDTAYLPTEPGIEVFDVTRPEEPASVRLLAPLSPRSSTSKISVVGERLIAEPLYSSADCLLYDISDSFSPLLTDAAPLHPIQGNPASRTLLAARFCGETTNRIFRIDSGRFVDCGPLPDPAVTNVEKEIPFQLVGDRIARLANGRLVDIGLSGGEISRIFEQSVSVHFVTDKIAYLIDGPDAVTVADFSDPRRPDIARCTNIPSAFLPPQGQRGRLYAASSNVLEVISVWKPLEPRRSRSVAFPAEVDVSLLGINGDYAYFADSDNGALRTYSIAGSNAVLKAETRFNRNSGKVVLSEKSPLRYAKERAPGIALMPDASYDEAFRKDMLIAEGLLVRSYGLQENDSTQTSLTTASLDTPLKTIGLHQLGGAVHGFCAVPGTNLLFAADSLAIDALRIVETGIVQEAHFPLSRHPLFGPRALAVAEDGVILAACGADGLRAYAYDGTNLSLRATCDTGGFAKDVAVSSNRVFIADGARGITVCNYADGKLEKVRTHSIARGSAEAVAVRDGIAYVAAGEASLAILSDIRPIPEVTREGGQHGAYALDIALMKHDGRLHAVVAEGRGGITIYDVSDPKSPTVAYKFEGDVTSIGAVVAVCAEGHRVYALDASIGLFVIEPFKASR